MSYLSPRRIMSYSSATSVTSSRSSLPAGPEAPSSAIPEDGTTSRPADIVVNRLHEVKRITKSLSTYFEGLALAHASHSTTLAKLSDPKIIQTPLQESALFIPAPLPGKGSHSPTSPMGQMMGWSDLLIQIKEENKGVADEHAALANKLTKDVVAPLKKLRVDIKAHITAMEKDVSKLSEAVLKERELTVIALSHLSRALHPPPVPSGLPAPPLTASDDPYLHSISAETQLKAQTIKENELLASVQGWQKKSEDLERDVFGKVADCWKVWEGVNSNTLLENQQRSVLLSANVDSVAPDAEWNYFSRLNYLLPASLAPASPESISLPHKDEPSTLPLLHGNLERQKRFMKTWKPAFFVLTPSGNLHEYSGSDASLDKPLASLVLKDYILGAMPEHKENVKGRPIEAVFTIEGAEKNVFRAKSWEEMEKWWYSLKEFTKVVEIPPTPVEEEENLGGPTSPDLPATPPALPPRAVPAVPVAAELPDAPMEESDIGGHPPSPNVAAAANVTSPISELSNGDDSMVDHDADRGGDIGVLSSPPTAAAPEPASDLSASTSTPILTEQPDSPSLDADSGDIGGSASKVEQNEKKEGEDVPTLAL